MTAKNLFVIPAKAGIQNNPFILTILLLVLVTLWSCDPEDPGFPLANQPPETRIVVAPLDSVYHDHYVSASPMFKVQWFGHDPDGLVEGYWIQIDNDNKVWTTATDSAIIFKAFEPDPDDPTRLLGTHTIAISAQDNLGMVDPSPATRTFHAVNYSPFLEKFVADFSDSSVVGPGINFSVEWSDPNISGAMFRLSVDGLAITNWDERSSFQFCDLSNPDILSAIETGDVYPVDIENLDINDYNYLTIDVKDLGEAFGTSIGRHVMVVDTVFPRLTQFSAVYGSADFFIDGSIFFHEGRNTTLNMEASAEEYFGSVQAFRYRQRYHEIGDTSWSEWSDWSDWGESTAEFADLALGAYQFQGQARDFAGVEGDTSEYTLSIVQPDFSEMNILIVNETKNGNGRPGSPDTTNIETFYNSITEPLIGDGWTRYNIRYASHKIADESYISPLDVYNKRIIIWNADDKSQPFLGDNVQILTQYLDAGGKLLLSGWDILGPLADADSTSFSSGFAYEYLRILSAYKDATLLKQFAGLDGNEELGCPDLNLDPAKVPASWPGIDKCWALRPEHRTVSGGTWVGSAEDVPLHGESAFLMTVSSINSWKTMVLGFPLYFMKESEATIFMRWVIDTFEE